MLQRNQGKLLIEDRKATSNTLLTF